LKGLILQKRPYLRPFFITFAPLKH